MIEAEDLGRQGAWNKFGQKGNNANQNRVTPGFASIQETKVSPETGKSEVLFSNSREK
jgi:hypothetical protein